MCAAAAASSMTPAPVRLASPLPPWFPRFGGAAGLGEASSAGLQRKAPTIERQLACSLEKPGDDDAGEEPPPQIGRLRVCDAGAGDASGERKEGSCSGLGLRFGLEAAAGVARGLPMAPLPVRLACPLGFGFSLRGLN